jgi:hypothetical protein
MAHHIDMIIRRFLYRRVCIIKTFDQNSFYWINIQMPIYFEIKYLNKTQSTFLDSTK